MLPSPARLAQMRFHPSQDPPQWWKEYVAQGGYAETATGITVTPDTAMRVTAALACIRILADTEASLPFFVYRRTAEGKEKASDHYLYPILHDISNPEMSAFTLRRTLTAHVASRGNGLAEKVFDGGGRVRELWSLNPDKIELKRDPRTKKLFYRITLPDSYGGEQRDLPYEKVFHIKWLSDDGLWGMSPVQAMAESLGISLAAQEYMGRFFQNDATPRGTLETDQPLSDKAWNRLLTEFDENHQGLTNQHRYAILEEGLKFNAVSLTPQDVMLLDLMRFGVEDVGRVWGISSDMLNLADKAATYASVEQFGIRFATHTMRPWLVNWEQEVYRSLLTKDERTDHYAEHNIDGLLRGDFKTRVEGYASGIANGWLVRNEARGFENMNPKDGLDEPLVQQNMQTNTQAQKTPPDGGNARNVMLPIYEDIFKRIQRREQHDHAAAEKKFKDDVTKFVEWRRAYYDGEDFQSFIAMQLQPALRAHANLFMDTSDVPDQAFNVNARNFAAAYCQNAVKGQNVAADWVEKLSKKEFRSDL